MAVRTGGPGAAGLSLLVVPLLDQEGVSMRRMKTMGSTTSGTTYIELDDVKVPVENLIGKVHKISSFWAFLIEGNLVTGTDILGHLGRGGDENDHHQLQSRKTRHRHRYHAYITRCAFVGL
jgi:alkylation response protein AidB-like acyl-CoA dehydrogenase